MIEILNLIFWITSVILSLLLQQPVNLSFNFFLTLIFPVSDLNSDLFIGIATIVASLTAIVFSVSLAFAQTGAEKYNLNLLKLFLREDSVKNLMILSFIIIFSPLILVLINACYLIFGIILILMMFIWVYYLWSYFLFITHFVTDEGMLEALLKNCESSIIADSSKKTELKNNSDQNKDTKEAIKNVKTVLLKSAKNDDIENIEGCYDILRKSYSKAYNVENYDIKKIILDTHLKVLWKLIRIKKETLYESYLAYFDIISLETAIKKDSNKEKDLSLSQERFKVLNCVHINLLFPLNKQIIERKNYEFFKEEILSYCTSISGFSSFKGRNYFPILKNLKENEKYGSIRNKVSLISYFLEEYLLFNLDEFKNYENRQNIDKKLSELLNPIKEDLNGEDNEKKELILQEIKKELLLDCMKGFAQSEIIKSYFMIGAYVFYRFEDDKSKIPIYLKAMWDITNNPPIIMDIDILTKFYITYIRKEIYSVKYQFKSSSSKKEFFNSYYILLLTWLITKEQKELSFHGNAYFDLKIHHFRFCEDFINISKDLVKVSEEFSKSEEWEKLFADSKFSFEKTKNWLEKSCNKCQYEYDQAISQYPLDSDKLKEFIGWILDEYRSNDAQLSEISEHADDTEEFDLEPEVCNALKEPVKLQRNSFIAANIGKRILDPDSVARVMGENIALCELSKIINCIIFNEGVEIYEDEISSFDVFKETVCKVYENMKSNGYNPKKLLIPMKFSLNYRRKFLQFIIDCNGEQIKVESNRNITENYVYLMDPSCILHRHVPNSKSQNITITPNEIGKEISFKASSEILYKISDTKGIVKIILSEILMKPFQEE